MTKSKLLQSLYITKGLLVLGFIVGTTCSTSAQYKKIIKCPGGQGYCEDINGKTTSGIAIQEDRGPDGKLKLTAVSKSWTNSQASLAWYLYTTAGEYDIDLVTKVNTGSSLSFTFSIEDINSLGLTAESKDITLKGKGSSDTTALIRFTAAKTGFYKFKLSPKNNPNNAIEVQSLQFKSLTSAAADVHPTNYLSSPSVHLNRWRSSGSVTSGNKYDWCYQEILVPKGEDPLHTYYMSLGVLSGYFGIQTNSPTERRVLFSMWDAGSTEEDPNLPEHLKAGFVDHAPYTTVNRFGGEGTGMQSYVNGWNWETGVPVKFLVNSRLEEFIDTLKNKEGADSIVLRKNTIVSAWFHSNAEKGWQYVSTLRMPNQVKYFDSWYSFLENFGYSNGQEHRKAYYYNAFAKEQSDDPLKPGPWRHFNQVGFGNTDGSAGQRVDFEQGAAPERPEAFYMTSGGYGPTKKAGTFVNLQTNNLVVDSLDLTPFIDRVSQALAKDKAKNDSIKLVEKSMLPKKGWKIIQFSSEETSGEGEVNGRVSCVIDNNPTTYWHSKWTGSAAEMPHNMTILMDDTHLITGLQITTSGGSIRRMKTVDILANTTGDKVIFTKIGTFTCPDQDKFYIKFDAPVQAKAVKLTIKDAQTNSAFCRINEIDITGSTTLSTPTVKATQSSITPNPAKGEIYITPAQGASSMNVTIFDLNGRTLQTKNYPSVASSQTITHNIASITEGMYTMRIKLDDHTESHKLIVKK